MKSLTNFYTNWRRARNTIALSPHSPPMAGFSDDTSSPDVTKSSLKFAYVDIPRPLNVHVKLVVLFFYVRQHTRARLLTRVRCLIVSSGSNHLDICAWIYTFYSVSCACASCLRVCYITYQNCIWEWGSLRITSGDNKNLIVVSCRIVDVATDVYVYSHITSSPFPPFCLSNLTYERGWIHSVNIRL